MLTVPFVGPRSNLAPGSGASPSGPPPVGSLPPAPRRNRGRRKCRAKAGRLAAVERLRAEALVSLADLDRSPVELPGRTAYPTAAVLLRWGIEGRRGVYLDVTRDLAGAWATSRAALARFTRDVDAAFWAEELAARTPTQEGARP